MKKNNKGFTLAEMLIVVAIIGILVAILVPSFTASLEKARESTDAANIRSKVAELTAKALTTNTAQEETVKATQSGSWEYVTDIDGQTPPTAGTKGYSISVTADGTATFGAAN